jgi:MraZ protein
VDTSVGCAQATKAQVSASKAIQSNTCSLLVAEKPRNVSQNPCVVGGSVIRWVEEGQSPIQGGLPPEVERLRCQGVHVFVGQYEHSLDNKGRVVLPAPFRSYVAERGYVTQLDGCIGLWSSQGFKEVAERWKSELDSGSISAGVFRRLMGRVQEVKVDGAGRITLSKELLDTLDFESKVIVSGRYDRAEIWPLERFESEQNEEDDIEFNETVRRLGI